MPKHPLPPYNPNASCPMCRYGTLTPGQHKLLALGVRFSKIFPETIATTRYCKQEELMDICWLKVDGEHFHRTCCRCHYEWLEACVPESPREQNEP